MHAASYWIEHLKLQPHPEGGFYRETYRSQETLKSDSLPERFNCDRQASTAIYFLLLAEQLSHLRKIKSDELWHFHTGETLLIYVLYSDKLTLFRLGLNLNEGDLPQVVIPANCWFGARVAQPRAYTLVSCTVSPGFDFRDFEMAKQHEILAQYPEHRETIYSCLESH